MIFGLGTGEEGIRFGTQEGMGAGRGRSTVSEKLELRCSPGRFPDHEKGCVQGPEARAGRSRILKRKVSMLPQGAGSG